MDDRARLLNPVNGKRNNKKDREGSGALDQDGDHYRSGYLYGTWDESSNTRKEPETSKNVTTDPATPVPERLLSPAGKSLGEFQAYPPSSSTLSSFKPALDEIKKIPASNRQQVPITNSSPPKYSAFSPSLPETGSRDLSNVSDKTTFEYIRISVAKQLAETLKGQDHKRTNQNQSSNNSIEEHQRINPPDTEKPDYTNGLDDFSKRRKLVNEISPELQPFNIKSASTKSPVSTKKIKSSSDADYPENEYRGLFVKPNMEFSTYGKKTNGTRDVDNIDGAKTDEKTPFFVYYLACFATIGGLLFGYDTGIVSGSMLLIKDYFDLSTMWQEVIVSGTVGAAAVFSLFAGFMCDFFGRKVTIMVASVVFVAGAVVMGASQSTGMLLAGRIIVGIGIGFASMTVPVYVAEAAPPAIRGRLVTLNQLFITIGILISSVIAGLFSGMKETGWRYMLGLAAVPGIIQFIGFLYLPESPRWLVMKGKDEEATKVLQRIRGKEDVSEEVKEIRDTVEEDKKQEGFVLGRVIRTQHVRRALFVGCGLQVFQQLCGINTVIYYSATILKMAGFPSEAAIWLVLVPNGINFLATFIGVALVERLGRRKLIIISFFGVVIALIVLAVGFQLSANFSPSINHNTTEFYLNGTIVKDGCFEKKYVNCEKCIEDSDCGFCYTGSENEGTCLSVKKHDEDTLSNYGRCHNETVKDALDMTFSHGYCPTNYTWMAVFGLALFVMAFAPGLGPMPWTINSEIYPMWARSTCTSMATGANWICNLLVSLFFLTLTETITRYGAFWLFAGICFLGMIFVIIFLPETKNKSLEEVEQLFKSKKKGAENQGYGREAPHVIGSNTRL